MFIELKVVNTSELFSCLYSTQHVLYNTEESVVFITFYIMQQISKTYVASAAS